MAIDFDKKVKVRLEALEFRRKHAALDWSASVDHLIERHGYEQAQFAPKGPSNIVKTLLVGIIKTVRALVSIKEKAIFIADNIHPAKEPFAKGHELGHAVIPWHKKLLFACDEFDLSASARDQLEFEANVFASEVLVPQPLLEPYYSQFPTTVETIQLIRNKSGASFEVCANAYVANHPRRCVLLVLEEIPASEPGGLAGGLNLKRKVVSEPAVKTAIAMIVKGQDFGPNGPLYRESRTFGSMKCMITVGGDKDKPYAVTLFNNAYKVFALISDE